MAEIEVSCEISCQKCGWNTGATIHTDEANVFEEVLRFTRGCSPQHLSLGPAGKLLVTWEPLEPEAH